MNRAKVAALLALIAAGGAGMLRAAPATAPGNDTNLTIDPAIAKASADADAAAAADVPESPELPYAKALLNYKSGKYDAARLLIDQADREQPDNVPILLLKVRILGELHDFSAARHVLDGLYDRPDLTPAYAAALELTTGDLALRRHDFNAAGKAYTSYLQAQPNDADAKLKLIYARIGENDLITAAKYASELKPLDAATPAYYFARAALARAGGDGDAEQDIEQARTIYGITVANRYLKTYLEVFAPVKTPAAEAPVSTPPKMPRPPAARSNPTKR